MRQLLRSMEYKGYTWSNNPSTTTYSVDKSYANHKYPELFGAEIEDMDANAAVITGSGEFFGVDAYNNWLSLLSVFNEHGYGNFYHPLYPNVTHALMTKLDATVEPRSNYVAYTFEFVAHDIIPWVKTLLIDNNINNNSPTSVVDKTGSRTLVVGDTVICNGYAYYDSYGAMPRSAKMVNKTMSITRINYNGTHPIHVGSIGWMRLSDVKTGNSTSAVNTSSSGSDTYVVKAGDNLTSIGNKYGVTWKVLADVNNIKNPNLIYPGDVIKIPK